MGDAIAEKDVVAGDAGGEKNSTKTVHTKGLSSCLSRVSSGIAYVLETAFFKVGLFVGEFPIVTILTMVIMCGLCGLGMKTFHETEEQEKLWVPQTSRLIPEKAWVDKTFPQETRFVSFLAAQPEGNILSPDSLNA
ncbi:unnamed protein product, partial [Candidula unifasciata]